MYIHASIIIILPLPFPPPRKTLLRHHQSKDSINRSEFDVDPRDNGPDVCEESESYAVIDSGANQLN